MRLRETRRATKGARDMERVLKNVLVSHGFILRVPEDEFMFYDTIIDLYNDDKITRLQYLVAETLMIRKGYNP